MTRRQIVLWWLAGGAAGFFGVPAYGAGLLGFLAAIDPIVVLLPFAALIALGWLAHSRASTLLLLIWGAATWLLLSAALSFAAVMLVIALVPDAGAGGGLVAAAGLSLGSVVLVSACVAAGVAWLVARWIARAEADADAAEDDAAEAPRWARR